MEASLKYFQDQFGERVAVEGHAEVWLDTTNSLLFGARLHAPTVYPTGKIRPYQNEMRKYKAAAVAVPARARSRATQFGERPDRSDHTRAGQPELEYYPAEE